MNCPTVLKTNQHFPKNKSQSTHLPNQFRQRQMCTLSERFPISGRDSALQHCANREPRTAKVQDRKFAFLHPLRIKSVVIQFFMHTQAHTSTCTHTHTQDRMSQDLKRAQTSVPRTLDHCCSTADVLQVRIPLWVAAQCIHILFLDVCE